MVGGGAHLATLRRTSVGHFTLDDARALDDVTLLDLAEALRGFATVVVDTATAERVAVGAVLDGARFRSSGTAPWAVCDGSGRLLAVYEPHVDGTRAKPSVVLTGSGAAGEVAG